jgi:hypothetical protein
MTVQLVTPAKAGVQARAGVLRNALLDPGLRRDDLRRAASAALSQVT